MAADDREHSSAGADDDVSPSDAEFGVRLTWPGEPGDADVDDDLAAPPEDDAVEAAADTSAAESGGADREASDLATDDEPFGAAAVEYDTTGTSWGGRISASSTSSDRFESDHFESASFAGVPYEPDSSNLTVGSMAPGLAGRIETLHTALNALAMRVEALVSGTSGMRSAIGDRLNDHADTLGRLVRSQASDLEEFQRGTDRTLTDLRRSAADTDEAVQRLSTRLDEFSVDLDNLSRLVESSVEEGRDLATASDKLSRQVVEGLDAFGDRLLERLDDLDASLAAEVGAGRSEVAHVRQLMGDLSQTGDGSELHIQLARLRDELADLNDTAEELPNLRADLTRLRADLAKDGGDGVSTELASMRAALDQVRQQQNELADAAQGLLALQDAIELVPADEDGAPAPSASAVLPGELADLRAELASLRADLIELTSNEGLDGIRTELAALRRRMNLKAKPAAVTLDDDQLSRLADEVGARLRTFLELDPDDRS